MRMQDAMVGKAQESVAPGYEVGCTLITLWAGKQAGVYYSHFYRTLVVRHGGRPIDTREIDLALDTVFTTAEDIGVRSTLVDLRLAPAGCCCSLCAMQPNRERGVLAAIADETVRQLRGLRTLTTFESALTYVRPHATPSHKIPCPLGFERLHALIAHYRGDLVFANYVGAVFVLPKQRAVYLHWSGDLEEGAPLMAVLTATSKALDLVGTSRLLVDHRHRPVLKTSVLEQIGRHVAQSKRIKQLTSIGSLPRGAMDTLKKALPRLRVEVAESLQEVLEDLDGTRARSAQKRAA